MRIKPYLKWFVFSFSILIYTGISKNTKAQCIPDTSIVTPGIVPDSATNMLPGIVGVPYTQIMQFKAPADSVIIIGGFPVTAQIVSIELTSLSGLPPGLSSTCNPANCVYPGGANGCAVINGTPTLTGIFPITAILTTSFTVFGTPATQIDTIDYYFITITSGVGIEELYSNADLILDQNVPNPVTDFTSITFYSSESRMISVQLHNLLGSEVYNAKMEAQKGQNIFYLNLSGISSGVYVYSIGNDEVKATKRLVIANE